MSKANFKWWFLLSSFCITHLFMIGLTGQEIGIPHIQKILFSEHGYQNQETFMFQDNNQVLYFTTVNGLYRFDGSNTRLFQVPKNLCFNIDPSGQILFGGLNTLGKVLLNNNQVILEEFPVFKNAEIGSISNILTSSFGIYFTTNNKLYHYHPDTVFLVDEGMSNLDAFMVKGILYYYNDKHGLKACLEDNTPWQLKNGDFFIGRQIEDILIHESSKLLIKCKDVNHFYSYDFDTVEIFPTSVEKYIDKYGYAKTNLLSNGQFSISTERGGVIIMDKNGNFISLLGKQEGLFDYQVINSFADKANNLWVLHNNGLSRVEYPSAVVYFNDITGLYGNVASVVRFNKRIHVATSQGVFKYIEGKSELNDNVHFVKIPGIDEDCKTLVVYGDKLFVATSSGIYTIDKRQMVKKEYYGSINTMIKSRFAPNLFYIGNDYGINRLSYTTNFKTLGSISVINQPVHEIVEEDSLVLWTDAELSSIINVNLKANTIDKLYTIFDYHKGLPKDAEWINIQRVGKNIVFPTSKGVYCFNKEEKLFYKDTLLGVNTLSDDQWAYPLASCKKEDILLVSGKTNAFKKKVFLANKKPSAHYELTQLPFNNLEGFVIKTIYHDNESRNIWIGGLGGLVKYHHGETGTTEEAFSMILSDITFGKDSVISYFSGQDENISPVLKFNYNNVRFAYTATSYRSEGEPEFSYYLKGFDKSWTGWNPNKYKEYTNLRPGRYTFFIKAKNINGKISNTIEFSFEILPPIYQTWYAYIVYGLFLLLIVIGISRFRSYNFNKEREKLEKIIRERTDELEHEKEKTERLLTNVLPKGTADELKSTGKATTRKYKMVTVLFSDIQGFTRIVEKMNPDKLVDELDHFFFHFDSVVEKYNIEKIKTIGDAYMCAGGLPNKNSTNPVEVVLAALEMQTYMQNLKKKNPDTWDFRVGIHTGSVIAGVVGRKKLSYDIWGDTVNTASRMESSGEVGKVNISGSTYSQVKDFFICEYRGRMPVKYKGEIDMYFVKGIRPELSVNLKGIPNKRFMVNLQFLRLNDLEEYVFNKLKSELPEEFYFHNLNHTQDVYTQVEILGRAEKVDEEDLLLLKTAALLHDFGYLYDYNHHEEKGVEIAKNLLPDFQYSAYQVNIICRLIMATKVPQKPSNLLEQIICDADLNYLGRVDFFDIADTLYQELKVKNRVKNKKEWNEHQLKFLDNHVYFTKTARLLKEVKIDKHIEKIKKLS